MKALEYVDKVIAFYSRPETGYGSTDEGCVYYVDAYHRCAVGCLLEKAWTLHKLLSNRFGNSGGSYFGIYNLAARWARGEVGHVSEEEAEALQEVLALPPEDFSDPQSHYAFFSRMQAIHDEAARVNLPKNQLLRALRKFRSEVEVNGENLRDS